MNTNLDDAFSENTIDFCGSRNLVCEGSMGDNKLLESLVVCIEPGIYAVNNYTGWNSTAQLTNLPSPSVWWSIGFVFC